MAPPLEIGTENAPGKTTAWPLVLHPPRSSVAIGATPSSTAITSAAQHFHIGARSPGSMQDKTGFCPLQGYFQKAGRPDRISRDPSPGRSIGCSIRTVIVRPRHAHSSGFRSPLVVGTPPADRMIVLAFG
jgi:hypothetical protein